MEASLRGLPPAPRFGNSDDEEDTNDEHESGSDLLRMVDQLSSSAFAKQQKSSEDVYNLALQVSEKAAIAKRQAQEEMLGYRSECAQLELISSQQDSDLAGLRARIGASSRQMSELSARLSAEEALEDLSRSLAEEM